MSTSQEPATAAPIRSLGPTEAAEMAALFKPLSDPTRVALFSALAEGELCVHELAGHFGMEQSTVSHQLRTLRDRNLVSTRRQGRHIHYSLADTHVRDIFEFALEHLRHTTNGREWTSPEDTNP